MVIETRGRARITVTTAWQDFCSLPEHQLNSWKRSVTTESSNIVVFSAVESKDELALDLVVPEYMSVEIYGGIISLNVPKKLQGDLIVLIYSGSVHLYKVKGSHIDLQCGDGEIHVEKALEGNVTVVAGTFNAKMLNANDVKINAKLLTIYALYCRFAQIQAKENVSIGLLKGSATVSSSSGKVSVQNVDGAVRLLAEAGDVDVQANNLLPYTFDATSDELRFEAPKGKVEVYLSPQVREMSWTLVFEA